MIFPLAAAALTVILNGTPMHSYEQPRVEKGHIVAPVVPYLTQIATRIKFENDIMVVQRGRFVARIRTGAVSMERLERMFVTIAPIYRALGEHCSYEAASRTLWITSLEVEPIGTMEPFNAKVPRALPTKLFTPEPVITSRPIFKGSPRPRRTPIPVIPSRP